MKQLSCNLAAPLGSGAPAAAGAGTRLKQFGALLLLGLGLASVAQAQQRPAPNFFTADAAAKSAAAKSRLTPALRHAQALSLDVPGLRAALATAPPETQATAAPLVLALPLPDGSTARFALREAPVMEPELAAKFPGIKTYAGVGLDDAAATVRLDLSPQGFHAQVLTDDGNSFYIDPATATDARRCLSFYRRDMDRAAAGAGSFSCGFKPSLADKQATAQRQAAAAKTNATTAGRKDKLLLRTYRLALANTPEYALTKGNTAAGVMAGEVATVNRVVGVYERELAVRLVLVRHNDRLIFLSGTGPQPPTPYDNFDGGAMLAENQANIDQLIGPNHYDIGHVVSTGGGGIAGLGVVCNDGLKAEGVTGSPSPVGDAFDIDYVAHEMGHQFAGNHTFNGEAGSCGGGNRNPGTAFEPGSGSTIMAYAGICTSANDLQPNSDPFFHTGNYEEMRAFIESGTCAVATPTGNTAPLVSGPANGKTLPVGTPFKLKAQAGDDDDNAVTYLWEEIDLGPADAPNDPQVAGRTVPLFRSFVPSASRTRYFPRLSDLLNNTTVFGERLPTVSRTLKFRCTARTAQSGPSGVVGSVAYTTPVELGVTRSAGPFALTAPNTAVTWVGGSAQAITWNVANTTAAPVSCARVSIRLSLNGGLTYPTVLADDEPNDGSAVVLVPRLAAANPHARLMVEAADNYFFDISNTDFTIVPAVASPTISSFSPTGGPVGTVVTILGSNFGLTTAVKFNGRAAARFTVVSATQLSATVAAGSTTGLITVMGWNGSATSATAFVVGTAPVVSSFAPATGPEGATVVIRGVGFTGTSRVTFDGIAATFTLNSATQITATVPVGATTGPVAVTTPVSTGQSASSFVVIQAPEIAAFTPGRGPAGTVVTISGNNFVGTSQVTFGGAAATYTVNSATQITATAPAGVVTGPILVTGIAGVGTSPTDFLVPPANDLCANAVPIACGQTLVGTTIGADAIGDPTGSCTESVDGGGVFYRFVGNGQAVVVSTCTPTTNYDSKLFVYSGTCGSLTCVGGNDDGPSCSTTASEVAFTSVAGTPYLIFVSGYAGAVGPFGLSVTCGPARPGTAARAGRPVQSGGFSVYPNPVGGQGTMHVTLSAVATSASATLRNVLGQPVATRRFSGLALDLPLSGLAAGTYLLTVQADGQAPITRRVVVE
ncbi:reprolysin-like metallopeptidase [Hymenobacter sp. UYCo722]|uniref:reprolysin-like metallopeptidase n=1 Tax=Hymenobacter sp. UYCo722 TaxID=3156335 RepID=UPI0033980118